MGVKLSGAPLDRGRNEERAATLSETPTKLPLSRRSLPLPWTLLIWALTAVACVVLVGLFDRTVFFTLAAIPILLTGWYHSWRWAVAGTVSLYVVSLVYLLGFFEETPGIQEFVSGLTLYILFALVGAFLGQIRAMRDEVFALNQALTRKNEELEELSLRDHLTKLHNRRFVTEVVLERARTFVDRLTIPEVRLRGIDLESEVIAVFMVDIDHFKSVNDTHGHASGDQVLVELSGRLIEAVRFDDMVVRWGGEEFLVVCPSTNRDHVETIIHKLLLAVRSRPFTLPDGSELQVTVSIGCTTYPLVVESPDAYSFEQIINISDAALYLSKDRGRDQASYVLPAGSHLEVSHASRRSEYSEMIQDQTLFTIRSLR